VNAVVAAPADAVIGSNPEPANSPVLIPGATPPPPAPVYETLKYWVFGTEMPRVVLNEVFTEYNDPPSLVPPPFPYTVNINVWAELFCPMPAAGSATTDATDVNPVLLAVPPGAAPAQTPYAPYRITIADTVTAANGGPLLPRPIAVVSPALWDNDNVLGTPDQVRNQTDDPNNPAGTLAFLGTYYTATLGQGTLTAVGPGPGPAPVAIRPQNFVIVGPGPNANPNGA